MLEGSSEEQVSRLMEILEEKQRLFRVKEGQV
jgi:electron transfer flavoprotein beta subunit